MFSENVLMKLSRLMKPYVETISEKDMSIHFISWGLPFNLLTNPRWTV